MGMYGVVGSGSAVKVVLLSDVPSSQAPNQQAMDL